MKKIMFCLAVAGMFAFAACNNAPEAEENAECTEEAVATEEVATEEVADSTAVAETVATEENATEEAAK